MTPAVPAYAERRGSIALLTRRDRAQALAIAGLLHVVLIALLLLLQGAPQAIAELKDSLTVVELTPPPKPKPPPPPPPSRDPRPSAAARPNPAPPAPVPLQAAPAPIQPPLLIPPTVEVPPGEASSGTGAVGDGEAGQGSGGGNGTGGPGSGGGPIGGDGAGDALLTTGRWQRPPSDRDFNPPPNMRRGAPKSGWGRIICRTARNYRLVDCVVHDEFPAGSGFAEAMRVASARFRFLATDSAGKPVVGQRVLVNLNFLEPKRR